MHINNLLLIISLSNLKFLLQYELNSFLRQIAVYIETI